MPRHVPHGQLPPAKLTANPPTHTLHAAPPPPTNPVRTQQPSTIPPHPIPLVRSPPNNNNPPPPPPTAAAPLPPALQDRM